MVTSEKCLDWHSDSNVVKLNPRWPKVDYDSLHNLAQQASIDLNLKAHVWLATSGTTASSYSAIKLVALSKQAFLNSAKAVNEHLKSEAADIWAQVLPDFHVGGLGIFARAYLSGAKVCNVLQDYKWDAKFFWEQIQKNRCTLSALVPTQVFDLVNLGLQCPNSMRAIVVGGGALGEELYLKARKLGWPLLPSYGMTETCSQIATASLESLNTQITYPLIELLSHAHARTNEQGFLVVHSNSMLSAYAQIQNGKMAHWSPVVNGWFTTEDKGQVVDNSLEIIGRGAEYIKIGGEAVVLSRLRQVLQEQVSKYAAQESQNFVLIDVPSDRLGAEIHLVCNQAVGAEIAGLIKQEYDKLVLPFERIRKIHFIDEIPRTDLGKVIFFELKKKIGCEV